MARVSNLNARRRRAARAARSEDAEFLKFCEAVGVLAGMQLRGVDLRPLSERLDFAEMATSLDAARAFLARC